MKNLVVIRHAKSSWDNPNLEDHQRPLNKRGERDAPFMANILKNYSQKIDKVVTSSAVRAKMTAEIFSEVLDISKDKIEITDELYNASRRDILKFLKKLDDSLNTVAIVGHNPGLTDLSHFLLYDFDDELPTCAVLCIELSINNWCEIKSGTGILKYFEYPKKYQK